MYSVGKMLYIEAGVRKAAVGFDACSHRSVAPCNWPRLLGGRPPERRHDHRVWPPPIKTRTHQLAAAVPFFHFIS